MVRTDGRNLPGGTGARVTRPENFRRRQSGFPVTANARLLAPTVQDNPYSGLNQPKPRAVWSSLKATEAAAVALVNSLKAEPTQRRALRNMRIHGLSSPQFSRCQDICTVRKTRSGCGIMIVKRPSAVVTPSRPPGQPFQTLPPSGITPFARASATITSRATLRCGTGSLRNSSKISRSS